MLNTKLHRVFVFILLLAPFYAGCQGPPGPQGPQGLQGLAGISGYEVVEVNEWVVLQPGHRHTVTATCPNGKKVLGGGYKAKSVYVTESIPVDEQKWDVRVWNKKDNAVGLPVVVRAICAIVEE